MDVDRIATEALLDALAGDPESPWADWYGKRLTARALAGLLRRYAVRSRTVRLGDGTARGFLRDQFEDAWNRYAPPTPASKRHSDTSPVNIGDPADSYPTQDPDVSDTKTAENPRGYCDVSDVSDTGRPEGATGGNDDRDWAPATAEQEALYERHRDLTGEVPRCPNVTDRRAT